MCMFVSLYAYFFLPTPLSVSIPGVYVDETSGVRIS